MKTLNDHRSKWTKTSMKPVKHPSLRPQKPTEIYVYISSNIYPIFRSLKHFFGENEEPSVQIAFFQCTKNAGNAITF